LTQEIVALENQSRRLESTALRSRADRRLASLCGETKEIDREMAAIVAGDPAKTALFACLVVLKGVGPRPGLDADRQHARPRQLDPESGSSADRRRPAQSRQRQPAGLSRDRRWPDEG
jgi:hypothetical protein